MKNKIWFFGDSVTKGVGCLKGDPYYQKDKKIFTQIVADKLGMEIKNVSIGGASTDWILHQILVCIKYMRPHDIVVVSNTLPWGTIMFNSGKDKLLPINDLWMANNEFLYNSNEEKDIIFQFSNLKRKYKEAFYEKFEKEIQALEPILKKFGVDLYQWDVRIWFDDENLRPYDTEYESIMKVTNEKIKDGHLSYGAHEKIAQHILNKIELSKKNKTFV